MNAANELLELVSKNTGKPVPKIFKVLGRGSNGVTFLTNNNPPKVLKIALGNASREINAIRKLQAAGANFIPRINATNFVNIRKTPIAKKLFPGSFNGNEHTLTAYTMSKVGNTTLYAYARTRNPTNNNKLKIRSEISRAIRFMHGHGISHGDLHAGNILVELDSAGKMKKLWVIDFGRYVNIPMGRTEKNVYSAMRKNTMHNNYNVFNNARKPQVQLWSGPTGPSRQNQDLYREMYGGKNDNLKRFRTLLSSSTRWMWPRPKK